MTEENKPEELDNEELKEVAESVPPPDEYPEGQVEALKERVEETGGDPSDDAGVEILEATEKASESPVAEAWDKGVTGLTESLEKMTDHVDYHLDHHDDTTIFMGREFPVPVYTFVFLALGALTLIEVITAEIFSAPAIRIPVLLGLAVVKSFLVMYFYMHLREDSRIFAVAVLLPFVVALLSLLFLLAVPGAGY